MKLLLILSILFIHPSHAIWWWFYDGGESQDNVNMETQESTDVSLVFAPFEISHGEQRFLVEAKHYLQNLPMLDQCNLLVCIYLTEFMILYVSDSEVIRTFSTVIITTGAY